MDKPFKRPKPPGRPTGSPNKGNNERNIIFSQFRCSQGFEETVKLLKKHAAYKSYADVLHEAVTLLAVKKLEAEHLIWINDI